MKHRFEPKNGFAQGSMSASAIGAPPNSGAGHHLNLGHYSSFGNISIGSTSTISGASAGLGAA